MDPVVRLFSPRFLQGQFGEDAWCSHGSSSLPSAPLPNPTLFPVHSTPLSTCPFIGYPFICPVGGGSAPRSPPSPLHALAH